MNVAIHNSQAGFHPRWVRYCQERSIPYKLVDCHANDIIQQLGDCKALMWHHHQDNPKELLFAKQLLFSLEQAGMRVFPDYNTAWHFDDKLGQKYLLEAVKAPFVPSYVFYDEKEALNWVDGTRFPKVLKLRGGAGSASVRLVNTRSEAKMLIGRAFGRGFTQYDPWSNLSERWRKYRLGKTNAWDVAKGIVRLAHPPVYSTIKGPDRGYVYFQDFIPGNDFDIRVIVIGDKAFAIKRLVRKNDFRASGSGDIRYEKENFRDELIKLSFAINKKIKSQSLALDYVFDNGEPKAVEISYGFTPEGYDPCAGYWDKNLNWHEEKFDPYGWMVEDLLKEI